MFSVINICPSYLSWSFLLVCVFVLNTHDVASEQFTQQSAFVGDSVSLTCPHYTSGTVAWQFNNPAMSSPTDLTKNGKLVNSAGRYLLINEGQSNAHILNVKSVTSQEAGLYSCHVEQAAGTSGPTQYIFLRVSVPVRNDTEYGPTTEGFTGTTEVPKDWDKAAVIFYLVLLLIIFAIFIGVVIVLCFRAQMFNVKKNQPGQDAEQQRLSPDAPKPGPSAVKS